MQKSPAVLLVLVMPKSQTESRWDFEPPRVGSRVRSASGEIWRVANVLQTGNGSFSVICAAPPDSDGARSIALDLLERARALVSPRERRRRKYIP